MSQGVTRRKPPIATSDTVERAPMTNLHIASPHATPATTTPNPVSRSNGGYRRVDPGIPRPELVTGGGTKLAPVRSPAGIIGTEQSLEQFVFEHGQYFDSYLATEPDRLYFFSTRQRGLISYVRRGRYALVGGGLIAPESHKDELLGQFVEHVKRHNLHVAFHNIGDEDLPVYRKHGFQVTKWGEEPVVDLGSCTWGGKPFEWVRRQTNFCQRHGLAAFEVRPEELEPEQWARTLAEVLEVAAESLSRKPQAEEMKFFEGRIDTHDLGLRRLFIARSSHGAGRIEGFVVCNPILGGTKWATELYRHRLDSVRGTVAFLFHHILQQLQAEGVRQVPMCLDPGRGLETPMPGDSFLIRGGLHYGSKYLGGIFDFAGVQHFKSRFRPRYENRYVCALPKVSFGSVIAFLRVFGVFNLNLGNVARIMVERARKRVARKTLSDNA